MKDIHKKWKAIGWNLIFFARARDIQQEIEDRKQQEIDELRQEVKELREQIKKHENAEIEQQLRYEEKEDRLTQQFLSELDQFDAANFLPHLPYLKGLQLNNTRYAEFFPGAQFRTGLDLTKPYPVERINKVKSQITENMQTLHPCPDWDIKRYFFNNEDRVICLVDRNYIIAAVYEDQASFETAKAEKSVEMDQLIDQMSR